MPQDIPLEASEVLVFTPSSLAEIEGAPTFTLRAVTTRDRRFMRRMHVEEKIIFHPQESLRREIITALRNEQFWSRETAEQHIPIIEAYWDAIDDFRSQQKDDPELVFEYDEDIVRACEELTHRVSDAHPPLKRMLADNADYSEMSLYPLVAVTLKGWTGLAVRRELDRGYFTLDCTIAVEEALKRFEEKHADEYGLSVGSAWLELAVKVGERHGLTEDEGKNSESPSPSETTPPALSAMSTSEADGTSLAPASSKKTPEAA